MSSINILPGTVTFPLRLYLHGHRRLACGAALSLMEGVKGDTREQLFWSLKPVWIASKQLMSICVHMWIRVTEGWYHINQALRRGVRCYLLVKPAAFVLPQPFPYGCFLPSLTKQGI